MPRVQLLIGQQRCCQSNEDLPGTESGKLHIYNIMCTVHDMYTCTTCMYVVQSIYTVCGHIQYIRVCGYSCMYVECESESFQLCWTRCQSIYIYYIICMF